MVLSDIEIREAIEQGQIAFDPPIPVDNISPSSIDLRLGSTFTTFPPDPTGFVVEVDPEAVTGIEQGLRRFGETTSLNAGDAFRLEPGAFVLAYTLESISLSNEFSARVEGRSSFARLGVAIHQTAPTVHATFQGQLRLEISNVGPFRCVLRPGMTIGQLIIERLGKPAATTLKSRFQGQQSP